LRVLLIRDPTKLPQAARSGAVTIGNFDGVHRGHARIIAGLIGKARAVGGPAIVLTFDPHPVRLLRPQEAPPPLTWTDRKADLLAELGVDAMIAWPTDESLLRLSAREFFDQVVRDRLDARAIVEGPNFFFGRDRQGNVDVLRGFAAEAGIALEVVEPLQIDGQIVSSSRVRRLIGEGKVDTARRMLTQPYRIRGMVTHGAGRGAKIGFPTANVDAIDTIVPAIGVYAGRAFVGAESHPAAISIGPNPTFGEHRFKVEVHLIAFHGALYGQPLEVDFLARLREIQTFAGVEQLKAQLARDVEQTRQFVERATPSGPHG
jgi:riboflavin kinase/FMN adenylyltransferase